MHRRMAVPAYMCLAALGLGAWPANAQITKFTNDDGRRFFVNADAPTQPKSNPKLAFGNASTSAGNLGITAKPVSAGAPHATIYLPSESSFAGKSRPAMNVDRDGVEKVIREAADRHRIDPALVRAVIETESNWNTGAISRKGALGLMQLIPTTAQRFGVSNAFNPQQNVEAGVRYLKSLLERYSGNLDLALAAYNAGEGAVDRAHGIPAIRETRSYVQKVQDAYFRPGSGRVEGMWVNSRAIRKNVDENGRVIFTNVD
jgi:soluble lytic murein transglycosylase-like protein